MMIADSSSRPGLCIAVRPGTHKAASVEEFGRGEATKYVFKGIFPCHSFVFNECWVTGQTVQFAQQAPKLSPAKRKSTEVPSYVIM